MEKLNSNVAQASQLLTSASNHYITNTVTSADGTVIGYRQYGRGPGLVLIQGAMGTAQNFQQLSRLLADTFTVYTPDRRGRGLSSSSRSEYNIQKEIEDLDALLSKTGARYVFGLSSGAVISLQAALTLPAIRKLAIYEPAFFIHGVPNDLVARYENEMAAGDISGALITAMQATQMGPALFNVIPRWLLKPLVKMTTRGEDKNGSGDYASMTELAPTLHNDFQVITEMNGGLERFKEMSLDVLLLGGSVSPDFLKSALDTLDGILPQARRVEFPGLGHVAAWNYDPQRNPGGDPKPVAQELVGFFTEP